MAEMDQMIELVSWDKFCKNIAVLYERGVNEAEIAEMYRGEAVRWEGIVKKNGLEQKYVKAITLNMRVDPLPLKNAKFLSANHLALGIDSDDTKTWRDCKIGDLIDFTAVIDAGGGPFEVIKLVSGDDFPEVVLMVSLSKCRLVENKGQQA